MTILRKFFLSVFVILLSGSFFAAKAGIRGPGKYSGVVIFDHWDTCLLLSGVYITYISDAVKEPLRPYQNQPVQIDALVVTQPMNPGDALIRKYTIIGPAPKSPYGPALAGVSIETQSDFSVDRETAFKIVITNTGNAPVQLDSSEIGPTLLGLRRPALLTPSDGKSAAWMTRQNLLHRASRRSVVDNETLSIDYDIVAPVRLPERFSLKPGESKTVRVLFKLPPGLYQFLVGYGGGVHEGMSLVSNSVLFHVASTGQAVIDYPASTGVS